MPCERGGVGLRARRRPQVSPVPPSTARSVFRRCRCCSTARCWRSPSRSSSLSGRLLRCSSPCSSRRRPSRRPPRPRTGSRRSTPFRSTLRRDSRAPWGSRSRRRRSCCIHPARCLRAWCHILSGRASPRDTGSTTGDARGKGGSCLGSVEGSEGVNALGADTSQPGRRGPDDVGRVGGVRRLRSSRPASQPSGAAPRGRRAFPGASGSPRAAPASGPPRAHGP